MTELLKDKGRPPDQSDTDAGSLYDYRYYQNYQTSLGPIPYDRQHGQWLEFSDYIANRLATEIGPKTVLDVGCAKGFLVESLRNRGIDAFGIDVSAYAIGEVEPGIRQYCRVGSVVEPIDGRYDLITCIEVLEHLSKADGQRAITNICQVTDDVVFSSTPDDVSEPSHVNVQPIEYWADLFAQCEFIRDMDFDATFIAKHAVRFRKAKMPAHALVRAYERWISKETATLRRELEEKETHAAFLDAELRHIRESLGGQILTVYARVKSRLLPYGTRRRIGYEGVIRAITVWRSQGSRPLLRKARSKLRKMAHSSEWSQPSRQTARMRPPDFRDWRVLIVSGSEGDMERYRCRHTREQFRLAGVIADLNRITNPALSQIVLDYDLVILHRVVHADEVQRVVQAAHDHGGLVLFDIDDLVFDPDEMDHIAFLRTMESGRRALFRDSVRRHQRALEICDAVIVTTEALAAAARRLGKPAWVHRNAPSLELIALSENARRSRKRVDEKIVIGYASGSPTHDRDFEEVEDALMQVLETYPQVELWVIGHLKLKAAWIKWGDRVKRFAYRPWRDLPSWLAQLDINLAPLEMGNPFCEAKSELKYFEAAAVGVPTVASRLGAFAYAIRHGKNGLLAENTLAWFRAIEQLIIDPNLRAAMGACAHADAQVRYHPRTRSAELLTTIEKVVDHLRGAGSSTGVLAQ